MEPVPATNDRIEFSDALNTLFDDINNNDVIQFGTSAAGNNSNTAANVNTAFEALFLAGSLTDGVTTANLGNAAAVATEFNAEFALTAANGEQTLLVINDTNNNSAAVWQWIQAGGGEIAAAELTLIAIINANATVNPTDFAFVA